MRTQWLKNSEIQENWYQIDASGKILGRLASFLAETIQGKNDPRFLRGVNFNKYVIVINAEKVNVTGNKVDQKIYRRHTGYTGHLKVVSFSEQMKKDPRVIIFKAVKGMLPSNSLGKNLLKNLKIVVGPHHKHASQNPSIIDF